VLFIIAAIVTLVPIWKQCFFKSAFWEQLWKWWATLCCSMLTHSIQQSATICLALVVAPGRPGSIYILKSLVWTKKTKLYSILNFKITFAAIFRILMWWFFEKFVLTNWKTKLLKTRNFRREPENFSALLFDRFWFDELRNDFALKRTNVQAYKV
jgi:hypothetical protein